jgi:ribosomal protein S18 acetylase RimI-like enzyme
VEIVELASAHVDPLIDFFGRLPEGDTTFIKEDVTDSAAVRSWPLATGPARRWVALIDDRVVGYLAVLALPGWSDHVAEIRLVVDRASRGHGVGRALSRLALRGAVEACYRKVIFELVADQESALRLFTDLGFTGEALLRDHIRDRDGQLHDLIMLAHYVEDTFATFSTLGLAEELA